MGDVNPARVGEEVVQAEEATMEEGMTMRNPLVMRRRTTEVGTGVYEPMPSGSPPRPRP
jgi:hypothetical protein